MESIGLALGGGGARGFAHLGVYKYLEEQNIKPDYISGTSAGAIIGAFLADGKSADETYQILTSKSLYEYSKMRFYKSGLIRLEGLKEDLKSKISVSNIEDLKIPLVLCATNINSGKVEYFDQGSIYKSVIASSSIPLLFSPMELNDNLYVDGGMFDNLPVTPLKEKCKKIIGVNISPIKEEHDIEGFIEMAARTFQLSVHANTQRSLKLCDVVIEPKKLTDFHILEIDKAEEMFEIGYKSAKNADFSQL